jgi:hypothetical protein
MDFQIVMNSQYPTGGLVLVKNGDIRTSIYNSINVKKGTFFGDPTFGCEHITKITAGNLTLEKQRVQASLAWLLQTGRAKTIDVIVEQDTLDVSRVNIKVTATQPNGLIITYQQYRPVGLGLTTDYYIQDGKYVGIS